MIFDQRVMMLLLRCHELLCLFYYSLRYNSPNYNFGGSDVCRWQEEIAFLNDLLTRKHPGPAQLVLMYGRAGWGNRNFSCTGQRKAALNLRIGKP